MKNDWVEYWSHEKLDKQGRDIIKEDKNGRCYEKP
jgi:hypothetical protein